jgi:hypothetical protein
MRIGPCCELCIAISSRLSPGSLRTVFSPSSSRRSLLPPVVSFVPCRHRCRLFGRSSYNITIQARPGRKPHQRESQSGVWTARRMRWAAREITGESPGDQGLFLRMVPECARGRTAPSASLVNHGTKPPLPRHDPKLPDTFRKLRPMPSRGRGGSRRPHDPQTTPLNRAAGLGLISP